MPRRAGKLSELLPEAFAELVRSSKTAADLLRRVGLRAAGGNHKTLKRYLATSGVDSSHFVEGAAAARRGNAPKALLKDILVKDSAYMNRATLKRRLVAAEVLKNECAVCGMQPVWCGRPLVLVLDHANGVWNDNRSENLRLLCPNCNSQTDTFCGRRSSYGTPTVCKCGKSISHVGGQCRSCARRAQSNLRPPKIHWPELEKIEVAVQSVGYCAVGRDLGVSDNAIRKHLKKLGSHLMIG